MEIQFETVKYHDFNARTSYLMMEMLHEIDFQHKIALRAFRIVEGAREPECALLSRASYEDHKILH